MNQGARAFYKAIVNAWHDLGETGKLRAIYAHWWKIGVQYPELNHAHYDSIDCLDYCVFWREGDEGDTAELGIRLAQHVIEGLVECYKKFPCK